MKNEYFKAMEDSYNLVSQANNEMISLWLKYTFLTWQWWVGVCLTIIPTPKRHGYFPAFLDLVLLFCSVQALSIALNPFVNL